MYFQHLKLTPSHLYKCKFINHTIPLLAIPKSLPSWAPEPDSGSQPHLVESRKKCRMWAFRHHSDYNSESESVSDSCLISESSSQGAVFGIECRVSSWQNSARFVFRGCVFVLCFPRIAIWAVKNKGSNPGEVVPPFMVNERIKTKHFSLYSFRC